MKITTKGRYALRVMIDLAIYAKDKYIPLHDIAKMENISMKYLEQIIAVLHKNNYIKSIKGKMGGYMLEKEPKDYKIGDILRLVEGDLKPVDCLKENHVCYRENVCKTH